MKGLQIKNGKIILSAYQAEKAVDYGSKTPEASKDILKTMRRLSAIRKAQKGKADAPEDPLASLTQEDIDAMTTEELQALLDQVGQ